LNVETNSSQLLVETSRLAKHYPVSQGWLKPQANLHAVDGVSFRLAAGKTLAVVGESGCGKSTLARLIAMLELPSSGDLKVANVHVNQASRSELKRIRPMVQMVFQNPYASLNPRKKVAAILDEPLAINTRLNKSERKERGLAMLARVGLQAEHYSRYPHMFSGGQRQRIAIARALMLEPRLIVADEAVSALDVSIQAQVLNLFLDLQESSGLAYLFISHNLAVVEHIADEVMVMYLGKIVEQGSKLRVFGEPLHPYTKALLASMPRLISKPQQQKIMLRGELPSPLHPPSGCAFSNRCPHKHDDCSAVKPELKEFQGRQVACSRIAEIA
jgi:dipeptide transport system ATP-binding protein